MTQVPKVGEYHLEEFKQNTDFSNPMYEMEGSEVKDGSSSGMYEVPEEMFDKSKMKEETSFEKPPIDSAVLSPSSIVHKSSPQVQLRQTALSPTSVETDKDTQKLVEEEDP
jgi:low density lipoprotein-related protein 2